MENTILTKLEENFAETLKYTNKDKAQKSPYFVDCVKDEIGKIAFNNNYEITTSEVDSLIIKFFAYTNQNS